MEYRVERDLLGEKQVPKHAYYGIQSLRAKDNFPITGYPPHPELIRAFGYVKKRLPLQTAMSVYCAPTLLKRLLRQAMK